VTRARRPSRRPTGALLGPLLFAHQSAKHPSRDLDLHPLPSCQARPASRKVLRCRLPRGEAALGARAHHARSDNFNMATYLPRSARFSARWGLTACSHPVLALLWWAVAFVPGHSRVVCAFRPTRQTPPSLCCGWRRVGRSARHWRPPRRGEWTGECHLRRPRRVGRKGPVPIRARGTEVPVRLAAHCRPRCGARTPRRSPSRTVTPRARPPVVACDGGDDG
jgi:hypothetical protein